MINGGELKELWKSQALREEETKRTIAERIEEHSSWPMDRTSFMLLVGTKGTEERGAFHILI